MPILSGTRAAHLPCAPRRSRSELTGTSPFCHLRHLNSSRDQLAGDGVHTSPEPAPGNLGAAGLSRMTLDDFDDLLVVLASWSWTAMQMATTPRATNLEGKAGHLAYAADVVYALLGGCGLVRKSARPYQTGSRR